MNDYVTLSEDQDRRIRHPRHTYVSADPYSHPLTHTEQGVLSTAVTAAGQVMAQRQMAHLSRNDETPITNALASIIYSLAYSAAGWLITAGLLFIIYHLIGGETGIYILILFIVWGCCLLAALYFNRRQGLWFSPAGLDHHEIDSRERIALHVIDRHIELIEKRWNLKD